MGSRFNRFAACPGAPFHCLPPSSGQGIVTGQTSTVELHVAVGTIATEPFGAGADQCLLFPASDQIADKSRMTKKAICGHSGETTNLVAWSDRRTGYLP